MKFIVDYLPYYGEDCPFYEMCQYSDAEECPRYWDKYKICSDNNPHECNLLIETSDNKTVFSNIYYDICPDCMAAIQKAIDGRKKEGDNDQY